MSSIILVTLSWVRSSGNNKGTNDQLGSGAPQLFFSSLILLVSSSRSRRRNSLKKKQVRHSSRPGGGGSAELLISSSSRRSFRRLRSSETNIVRIPAITADRASVHITKPLSVGYDISCHTHIVRSPVHLFLGSMRLEASSLSRRCSL